MSHDPTCRFDHEPLTVRREGDWLIVEDEDGTMVGKSIAGYGPHAPAPVDVAAALLVAVSKGAHQ